MTLRAYSVTRITLTQLRSAHHIQYIICQHIPFQLNLVHHIPAQGGIPFLLSYAISLCRTSSRITCTPKNQTSRAVNTELKPTCVCRVCNLRGRTGMALQLMHNISSPIMFVHTRRKHTDENSSRDRERGRQSERERETHTHTHTHTHPPTQAHTHIHTHMHTYMHTYNTLYLVATTSLQPSNCGIKRMVGKVFV